MHLFFAADYTYFSSKISDIVNSLSYYIISYKVFYKPSFIKNYIQSETNWDEMKYLLPTGNTNRINICVIAIEIQFLNLILHFASFIVLENIIHMEQLTTG